ncbi:Zinc finger BED domain-containing protein DAYSLEEPER [Striga hermonthica]|uniref:Zinc finger BED domain-containing protein DAYSLEEPER n=2 Tax=Striga hermonthica TaxID=68872 RepID=A0A9N7QZ14_STRHE|nr:Zinc finger BED domain-containing protein DAYSLEEPER [Striga hermonthica]
MEQQPPTAGGDGPGRASASVVASSASKRRLQLKPPQPVVVRSVAILPPNPTTGSKRSSSTNGSSVQSQGLGLCLSSATPSSSPATATATDASSLPSGGVSGVAAVGSGPSGSSGHNVDAAGANHPGGQKGANTANAIVVEGDEAPSGDEVEPDGKRQKRCISGVWKYFTKKKLVIEDNGKVYIQKWAYCNYPMCKHKARCEGNYGTTGFWTRLRVAHSVQKGQQQLKVEKDGAQEIKAVVTYRYDEEASLRKFYLAIVMHEYPFNTSEHEYFVDFIKSLRPSFPIKSRVSIRKEIMSMFLEEKEKLYAYFKFVPCRLSATMDMWTSNQNKSYMCVTVHWIDENWCIQKRIVNFVHVEGRHTGAKLSETFTELMIKWNIDKKLFALTLDNASANEVAVKDIISDLRANSSASALVCDGLFFHVRCACHILNLVARDGLSVITPTIENIRKLVLAVKGSPLQWEELMKRATACGLDTNKGLSLDVSTRWNSTYLMLRDALYYKNAFMRLKSSDHRRYENITPSPSEWAMAFKLFQCLKKFFDLTELFSGTLYPTANLFYRGFCEIKILLDEWSASQDNTICTMATSMSRKFEKYWKKSSTTLAVACFLDPRYKKRLIEFYMRKFHGNASHVHVDELVDVIKKLYQFYVHDAPMSSRHKGKSNAPSDMEIDTADLLVDNGDDELESYLYESSGPNGAEMNELDKYMADPPLRLSGQFDVLAWWKNQTDEYPVLSRIAHDLLAVQVSTVASESAFSAGGRVVDPFRSHLEPEIVEALICLKDWIAAGRREKKVGSIVCDLEVIEALVEKLTIEDDDVADSDGEMDAHGSWSNDARQAHPGEGKGQHPLGTRSIRSTFQSDEADLQRESIRAVKVQMCREGRPKHTFERRITQDTKLAEQRPVSTYPCPQT